MGENILKLGSACLPSSLLVPKSLSLLLVSLISFLYHQVKVSESFLSILNFCLGIWPSGIPLTFAWIAFRFSTHRDSLYRLWAYYLFFLLFSLSFFSFLSCLLSFCPSFSRHGHMKGSNCFILRNDLRLSWNGFTWLRKLTKSPIKRKKDWSTTLMCPKFYFYALYDSYLFSYEFNKGLECSTSPIETIHHL